MALFDENLTITPATRPPMQRSMKIGLFALAIALVILAALSFLPTSYVIQQPGPVYNTLGTATTADGTEVPLISVEGAESFETAGSLDLLTVQVVGNRERTPSWVELLGAWFDTSKAVVPLNSVFPEDTTTEERNEESAQMMVDSQEEATAAALIELGYDVGAQVSVGAVGEDSPATGILDAGDAITAVNGVPIADADGLRAEIQTGDGAPVTISIVRDGEAQDAVVTPTFSDETGTWLIGVVPATSFDFPVQVTIQLDNVGGPSAGMMFALGIIDTMTPDELNGGKDVAGTGTIDAAGVVGPIGGIRQKLYGALGAGAEYFLSPESNCNEVVGHVPDGLRVFSVATLDDSLAVLEALRDDGDLDALPTCTAG